MDLAREQQFAAERERKHGRSGQVGVVDNEGGVEPHGLVAPNPCRRHDDGLGFHPNVLGIDTEFFQQRWFVAKVNVTSTTTGGCLHGGNKDIGTMRGGRHGIHGARQAVVVVVVVLKRLWWHLLWL